MIARQSDRLAEKFGLGTRFCHDDAMTDMIPIDIGGRTIPAYRSVPAGDVRGGVVLIHEIWGLVDHIKNVADRLAAEGYLVIAPDILSGAGISPEVGGELQALVFSADEEERSRAQPLLREKLSAAEDPAYAEWAVSALQKVVDRLAVQPGVEGRMGVAGFCFGGSYAFALAAADPRVRVAIPFYGSPPDLSTLAGSTAAVLAFYGDEDERLIATLPDVERAMTAGGVDFRSHIYEGVGHAFFNDSNSVTYDFEAASDAWRQTLGFLQSRLSPAPPSEPE